MTVRCVSAGQAAETVTASDKVYSRRFEGSGSSWGETVHSPYMVTIQLTCRHCGSENIVRNGITSNGKQRFLCKDCGKRSRQNPQPNGYTEEEREKILRAYQERSSIRGLTRTFGVSRNTVSSWLKKRQQLSRS